MDSKDGWNICASLGFFLLLFARISAHMNMYMTEAEVLRVLGESPVISPVKNAKLLFIFAVPK